MAKTRRSYTDEDKAKILAHNAEHGPKVTAEHFNIVPSMIQRWKKQAQPVKPKGAWGPGRKKWTDEKVAAVLTFLKTHTHGETKEHFKISSSQISLWRRGLSHGHYKAQRKANGAATNGLGVLNLDEKTAFVEMQRWRDAYFELDKLKRELLKTETPTVAAVLAALRGGK